MVKKKSVVSRGKALRRVRDKIKAKKAERNQLKKDAKASGKKAVAPKKRVGASLKKDSKLKQSVRKKMDEKAKKEVSAKAIKEQKPVVKVVAPAKAEKAPKQEIVVKGKSVVDSDGSGQSTPQVALVKPLVKVPKKGKEGKEDAPFERDIPAGDLDDGLQELGDFEVVVDTEIVDIEGGLDLQERGDVESRIARLLEIGKEKGYLTMDEVNEALAGEVMTEDQVEDVVARFGEHDIDIIEQPSDPQEEGEMATGADAAAPEVLEAGSLGRSTDPVRQYLREMGNVSLLTREGEVEIAKRIESGLIAVREQLLKQPLSLNYVADIFDKVKNDEIRLRDLFAEEEVDPNAEAKAEEEEEEEQEP